MNYNTDLIHFIQNAAGWAIAGDTSEQTMLILFGTGANGKSAFLNTIMNLLGNYAIATPTETFMKKSGEQITNDIARLPELALLPLRKRSMGEGCRNL
jgi:putative DNA primase/helicase